MKNKQLMSVALATALLTTGLALTTTNAAFSGENEGEERERPSHEEMQEQRDAVRAAIEANDYASWQAAMSNHPKAAEFVNEETFSVLVQAHALAEAGDKDAAKALLEENNIHRPGKRGHHGPRPEVREAIENGDYAAWAEALANHPEAESFVNQETFATLQEAHALVESGDKDAAKALLDEAGIKRPGKSRR